MNISKILHDKFLLKGEYIIVNGIAKLDETSEQIERLIKSHLEKIGSDQTGWDRLYRDPIDNRYWELTYPTSELHGGGAPMLACISMMVAKEKYRLTD